MGRRDLVVKGYSPRDLPLADIKCIPASGKPSHARSRVFATVIVEAVAVVHNHPFIRPLGAANNSSCIFALVSVEVRRQNSAPAPAEEYAIQLAHAPDETRNRVRSAV